MAAGSPFQNVASETYWTSTSYFGGQAGSPNAWALRMADGRFINDSVANAKATAQNRVWAVRAGSGGAVQLQATGMWVPYVSGDDGSLQRGVPLPFLRWIDRGDGTVADTLTGLVWLRQCDAIKLPWAEAVAAIRALGHGQAGLTDGSKAGDWRMPNRKEMLSLADRAENNQADYFDASYTFKWQTSLFRAPVFTNLVPFQYYWTSSTDAADPTKAWSVFSCDFGVYDTDKALVGYSMAVRDSY